MNYYHQESSRLYFVLVVLQNNVLIDFFVGNSIIYNNNIRLYFTYLHCLLPLSCSMYVNDYSCLFNVVRSMMMVWRILLMMYDVILSVILSLIMHAFPSFNLILNFTFLDNWLYSLNFIYGVTQQLYLLYLPIIYMFPYLCRLPI